MMVDEIDIKLVMLGYGGVGKTSIVNSYMKKGIPERYIPTIGSNINKVGLYSQRKEYSHSHKYLGCGRTTLLQPVKSRLL